ncbi:MAG TPA: aminoacyl-tRNA hydrolase, partial [Fodinibius sp.]|nr:aminoacyl-tRNA hydrolase [Fodinibius sp.]
IKYRKTKHNIGFMVVDELASRFNTKLSKTKFNAKFAVVSIAGEKVLLIQPQTYMNLSGEAIRPLLDYYNAALDDVLVIYDDLDLPTGKIRLRQKGGHGGHNGIRSTIDHLGTKEFKRLRIGVGRPTVPMPVVDYVLKPFSKEQEKDVESSIEKAAKACETWIETPFAEVMNEFNA